MPTSTYKATRHKQIRCPAITAYLREVETGKVRACREQKQLAAYIRRIFAEEELYLDNKRYERYINQLAFFPFDDLYSWERFLLMLFCCVFKADGTPRWPDLLAVIGRGAGKNGFIAFVSWCLTTRINGIEGYNVDICANTEDQAKISFNDIWTILDSAESTWKPKWAWSKTYIQNRGTGSIIKYRTNSPTSRDGMRPGICIFDEVHQYTDWANITVFTTSLGKVDHPRRAFITSCGHVRDGVLDRRMEIAERILAGEVEDNGWLPFICKLDEADEVHDPANWEKANPSLPYNNTLQAEIAKEYNDWLIDPIGSADFMTKRMNCIQGDIEHQVTEWENLLAASRPIPEDLEGESCVCGIDFARTSDFVSACLLFRRDGEHYAIHHSWWCTHSKDASLVRAPLDEWAAKGIITIVDDVEVHPSLVTRWIYDMTASYYIEKVAIDDYRYTLMMRELREIGYDAADGTVRKVRPSDHMRVQPIINSDFVNRTIAWGDDPAMRWFTNNVKIIPLPNSNGNYKYDKIEPKSRKTDGFMALVAAYCIEDAIPEGTRPDQVVGALTF